MSWYRAEDIDDDEIRQNIFRSVSVTNLPIAEENEEEMILSPISERQQENFVSIPSMDDTFVATPKMNMNDSFTQTSRENTPSFSKPIKPRALFDSNNNTPISSPASLCKLDQIQTPSMGGVGQTPPNISIRPENEPIHRSPLTEKNINIHQQNISTSSAFNQWQATSKIEGDRRDKAKKVNNNNHGARLTRKVSGNARRRLSMRQRARSCFTYDQLLGGKSISPDSGISSPEGKPSSSPSVSSRESSIDISPSMRIENDQFQIVELMSPLSTRPDHSNNELSRRRKSIMNAAAASQECCNPSLSTRSSSAFLSVDPQRERSISDHTMSQCTATNRPATAVPFSMSQEEFKPIVPINEEPQPQQQSNLYGDKLYPPKLPILDTNVASSIHRIDGETVAALLDGKFRDRIDHFVIIDCRYTFEYETGHIQGAIHIDLKEKLIEFANANMNIQGQQSSVAVIFHCEYSKIRGPRAADFFRELDRSANEYPVLTFPDTYVLNGGYRQFYPIFPDYCEGNYTPMWDDNFAEKHKFCSAQNKKSWSKKSTARSSRSRALTREDMSPGSQRRLARLRRTKSMCKPSDFFKYR